jgi:hypothetical protein
MIAQKSGRLRSIESKSDLDQDRPMNLKPTAPREDVINEDPSSKNSVNGPNLTKILGTGLS